MKKWFAWILMLSGSFATTAFADEANPTGRRPPPPPQEIIAEHAAELGINQATMDEITRIFQDAHPELRRLHEAVRKARAEHGDGSPELQAAERAIRARHEALDKELRRLLTDAQWKAVRELLPPPPPPPGGAPPPPPGGDCGPDGSPARAPRRQLRP